MKLFANQLGLDFKKNHRCLKTSWWLRVIKFTYGTKSNLFCQGILNSTIIVGEHKPNIIHRVPIRKSQTWANKGSKHVLVHGMEDKPQVTILISSSISTNLLPFQIIFIGLIKRSLPLCNIGQKMCEKVMASHIHRKPLYSNLTTCKKLWNTYYNYTNTNKWSKWAWIRIQNLFGCWIVGTSTYPRGSSLGWKRCITNFVYFHLSELH